MSRDAERPAGADAPRLFERVAVRTRTCRCGTRIPAGSAYLEIEGLPELVAETFHDQPFCSAPCARASFLEKLSLLEALDTPQAEALVTDLREMYLLLAASFATIVAQSSADSIHVGTIR